MKISEIYNLNKNQFQLDFVDIDVDTDMPLFIDSNLIRNSEGYFLTNGIKYKQFFTNLMNLLSNSLFLKKSILRKIKKLFRLI